MIGEQLNFVPESSRGFSSSNVTNISSKEIVVKRCPHVLRVGVDILSVHCEKIKRQYCIMYTTFDEPRIWRNNNKTNNNNNNNNNNTNFIEK